MKKEEDEKRTQKTKVCTQVLCLRRNLYPASTELLQQVIRTQMTQQKNVQSAWDDVSTKMSKWAKLVKAVSLKIDKYKSTLIWEPFHTS